MAFQDHFQPKQLYDSISVVLKKDTISLDKLVVLLTYDGLRI